MEAMQDEELEKQEEMDSVEAGVEAKPPGGQRAESLAQLEAFKANPNVNISESYLARELKVILEQAQQRIAAGNIPSSLAKKKKEEKRLKRLENARKAVKEEPNLISSVLKKVEKENGFVDEPKEADDAKDDENIIDGFMEGFNEPDDAGWMAGVGPGWGLALAAGAAVVGTLLWTGGSARFHG